MSSSHRLEAELLCIDSDGDGGALFDLLDIDSTSRLQAYLGDTEDARSALVPLEQPPIATEQLERRSVARGRPERLEEHRHAPTKRQKRSVEERSERRRLQLVASARRHRDRKKSELMQLQEEAEFLELQLQTLREQRATQLPSASVARWEERAARERHQRRRVEALNAQLRAAANMYGGHVRGLRTVFSSSPMVSSELNMHQLLHSYAHLGLSPASRQRECHAMYSDSKLDRAMQILVRETDGVSLESPSLTTRPVRVAEDQFGITCVGTYALETVDSDVSFHSACRIVLSLGFDWPKHTRTSSNARLVHSPVDSIRYGIYDAHYANDATGDEVVLAGRVVSYYRVTSAYVVLVWDFVDEDDMHPLPSDTTVRRDVTGALLIRQETCPDGVERLVCRSACTKLHTFQGMTADSNRGARLFAGFLARCADACNTKLYDATNLSASMPSNEPYPAQVTV